MIELAEPLDTAASRDLLAAFGKYRAIEQDVWQEVTDDFVGWLDEVVAAKA